MSCCFLHGHQTNPRSPSNRRPREEQSNGYFDTTTCRLPDNETVTRAQSQNACSCVMLRSREKACLPRSVSRLSEFSFVADQRNGREACETVILQLASTLKLSQLSLRPLEAGRATSAACSAESLVGENGLVIFAIRRPG